MWNEPSIGVAVSALAPDAIARQPKPAVVDSVEPGSIGDKTQIDLLELYILHSDNFIPKII